MTDTKRIYFVRHGETAANVRNHAQGPDSELNETGFAQAAKIAARVANLGVKLIISSDLIRARQTTETILAANPVAHVFSPLFREVMSPTSLLGTRPSDPQVVAYHAARRANVHDPSWHYEDEENVIERAARADAARKFLEETEESDLLVVTHGHFLKNLVGHLLLGESCTFAILQSLYERVRLSNTGLTLFVVENGQWNLVTLNDHSHLG